MFRLRTIAGPKKDATFEIAEGDNTLGREASCTIPLSSKTVSRTHATIRLETGTLTLTDNGSSNGTLVNGERVTEVPLHAGDRICMGEFVFELIDEEATGRKVPGDSAKSDTVKKQAQELEASPLGLGALPTTKPSHPLLGKAAELFAHLDWPMKVALLLAAAFILNHLVVMLPIINSAREDLIEQAISKGRIAAQGFADKNRSDLLEENHLLLDCETILEEPGIREAIIANNRKQIVCPPGKIGQYLRDSLSEATMAQSMVVDNCEDRIVSQNLADCEISAPIVASQDQTDTLTVIGTARLIYTPHETQKALANLVSSGWKSLVLSAVIACLLYFAFWHVSLRPIMALKREIDSAVTTGALVSESYTLPGLGELSAAVNGMIERAKYGEAAAEPDLPGSQILRTGAVRLDDLSGALSGRFFALDGDHRFVMATHEFADLLDRLPSECVGQTLTDIIHDEELVGLIYETSHEAHDSADRMGSSNVVVSGTPYSLTARPVPAAGIGEIVFYTLN